MKKKNVLVNLLVPGRSALKKRISQLEKKVEENETILSAIAHDLRSPFQAINGFSEILTNDDLPPDRMKFYACLVHGQAVIAFALMEALTDYYRAQRKQIIVEINLKEEVNNIISFFEPSICQKDIKISNFVSKEIILQTDINALKAIIRNLLSNAIKFTPEGKGIIISAINADGVLEISVTDMGGGIKKERLEKIFSKLSSTPGTNQEKGSGLGLFICREMTKKIGGQISVHSTLGKGAIFTILLPSSLVKLAKPVPIEIEEEVA